METTLVQRTPVEPRPRAAMPARPAPEGPRRGAAVPADPRFAAAVATDAGPHHAANEDAASDLARGDALFVVADGVGGGALACVASRALVQALHAALAGAGPAPTPESVQRAVLAADRSIAARIARFTREPGAATVVLAAPIDAAAARWLVAWVGDCRAYRLARGRGGRLGTRVDLLTRDDTFRHLREAVPAGSTADDPARMVGNGAVAGVNVAVHDLGPGEVLALCTDGVHKRLGAGDWKRVLARPAPLAARCEEAIRVARAHGSRDDATLLLVERVPGADAGDDAGGESGGWALRLRRALGRALGRGDGPAPCPDERRHGGSR